VIKCRYLPPRLIFNCLSVHTIKKNAEVASNENGLVVNADKTKYMMISPDQHAGQSHSMKTDNSSFERVE
jgi:hypothetical protein